MKQAFSIQRVGRNNISTQRRQKYKYKSVYSELSNRYVKYEVTNVQTLNIRSTSSPESREKKELEGKKYVGQERIIMYW